MEERWNLIGKRKIRIVETTLKKGCDSFYGCYDEEDIETLREHLIEDYVELLKKFVTNIEEAQLYEMARQTVNKRYGVK